MRCPRCGEENPGHARFCLACGTPLEHASRQERKVVSVLFVDLVGFTASADRRDPEDVRDLLESYHEAARKEIESFGGNVEKFIGDAVMAVFGAPITHGDDAERAVRAGLKVLNAVDKLGVPARAAVNTGEAVVAVGAAASAGQSLAMGDVVNTASRLQQSAPAGRLVVGIETHLLTRDAIRYEPLPEIAAKGKQDPIETWLAVEPIPTAPERPITPMLGRDREMALLLSIWDSAVSDRRPQLVTIVGPPGIGKSRLQREFSAHVRAGGGEVVRGRCLPYGGRAAYGAFIQLIASAAGVYETDSQEVAKEKLAATVGRLLPADEVETATFYLSILMGLGSGEQSLQRSYLFFAARRFVEALAATSPLLLVLEDLHWADNGLLDLIEYLASRIKDAKLVIVALARPEFLDQRPSWASGLYAHTTVAIEPLAPNEAARLTTSLLRDVAGREDMVSQFASTAEGNPLFIEELTSAFVEGRQGASGLPTSVRAAIASRLDALPAVARQVLLDASVMGRNFWRGVLVSLDPHTDVDDALGLLESRDFVRRVPSSRVEGDVEYQFKHILIQEVAYATLPRASRRLRHASVAAYIESVSKDTATLSPILANHWREGGEPQKAIEYLLIAAEQALNAWALNDAVSLYQAAIDLAGDEAERDRIRLARGLARGRLLDYPAAVAELTGVLPRLTGRDRIEGLVGLAWASEWVENTDETIAASEEAIALAEAANDSELLPVGKALLSQGLAMRGDSGDLDAAGEIGEEALRLWVPGTRTWWRLNHEYLLGEQFYWTGRLGDAHSLMTSGSWTGTDPQSIQARLRAAALMAQLRCATGHYEESIRLFDETIRLAETHGRPLRVLLNYSTLPLRELFDVGEARRRSEECLDGADEKAGFLMPRANARADMAQAAVIAGDPAAAQPYWDLQWEESRTTRAWTRWLLVCRLAALRAEMELQMGHVDGAIEWSRRTIEVCQPVRRVKYEIAGRTLLGRALAQAAKHDEAVVELRRATEEADRLGTPSLRWRAQAALGRALYASGDDLGAERAFAAASAVINETAAGLSPERAKMFLGAEPIREALSGSTKPATP